MTRNRELAASIECGDIDHLPIIIQRLRDNLPDVDGSAVYFNFLDAAKEMEEARAAYRQAAMDMRERALAVLALCERKYSDRQVAEATGYGLEELE